ncbi:unsaturated chondroitin disaccharide hydrolase [Enterococcus sp. PF1-24]|uniref:glycoside hydrolase family 88 protein n=1 Tax=unclassified Enterococcus TaxID=2608891 RepID=UPI0024746E6F|nr:MULTISPECIES: glycoside hydrolase family 88 protein [unclassified Enterococcus]MDH6363973.1 unsaturated chondroitin disaccharide hydrolase [Enterococcus sp. PFB1-1]MDH6401074.1 unsaturated chondroitin disaccharide hydrolase [Enterococcus sp. PF1-24]
MVKLEVAKNLDKIQHKVICEIERLGEGIPYIPDAGKYKDMKEEDISWWTNGFFAGMLWHLYQYSGNEIFSKKAIQIEQILDQAMEDFFDLHHDVGFMWLHTAVANYRITKNSDSYLRGMKAASILAARFNHNGNYLRAWNDTYDGWTIIDSMMNIPLLYWASNELNDPRYSAIATLHAETIQKNLIRSDGSVGHIGNFDSLTGEFLELLGGQGFSGESAWSRGQAWAIYGFALSYKYTKKETFLKTAQQVAHYFLANVASTDYVPAIDFKAPDIQLNTDTSASVIAACGLLEISEHLPDEEKHIYVSGAEKVLQAVLGNYCNFDDQLDGIVEGGAVAYHHPGEKNVALIYSDYFLVEALLKISKQATDLW